MRPRKVKLRSLAIAIWPVVIVLGASQAQAKSGTQKIVVGIVGNFSPASDNASHPYGQQLLDAGMMALDEYADKLKRAGVTVQLKEFDHGSGSDQVIATAEKAVKSDAIAVMGFIYSTHVLMAAETFQKGGMMLLSPTATADKIDNLGVFIRRSCFSDTIQGKMLAKGALKLGVRRIAITAAMDCAYCQSLKAAFLQEFRGGGGQVAVDVPVLINDTDFIDVSDALHGQSFDAILVPNYERPASLLVADLIGRGVKPKLWLGGDAWNANGDLSTKILKNLGAKALIIAQWQPISAVPRVNSFIKRFNKRFGRDPVDAAALAYDGMRVILEAILKDPIRTRLSISRAVGNLGTIQGVTGDMKFFSDRATPEKAAHMLLIDGDHKDTVRYE